MGGLGHNADAVYVVFFTRRTVGGRLLVEAVVNAYTSINRLSMTVQSIGEIDGPEDVRSLLKAAKIYARHLIVLNEAAR